MDSTGSILLSAIVRCRYVSWLIQVRKVVFCSPREKDEIDENIISRSIGSLDAN